MDFVNETVMNILENLLSNANPCKLVILWGEQGSGKTSAIHSALKSNSIKTKDIVFSAEHIFPLNDENDLSLYTMDENRILEEYSNLLKNRICLLFQNMECCDPDSERLLFRMLKYHKRNSQRTCVVLEYNSPREPNDILCSLAENKIYIDKPDSKCFYDYLQLHFSIKTYNLKLFEEIVNLTQNNIQNFFMVLNVLSHLNVISKNEAGLYYFCQKEYKIPNSLLELYIELFETLKEHTCEALILSAPFSRQIYSSIIHGIYQNYYMFEEYLSDLSKYESLISSNCLNKPNSSKIFQAPYVYTIETARKAVLAKTAAENREDIASKYYGYLDSLYHNKKIYDNLEDNDKILLLLNISKKRQGSYSINQVPYIAELMQYYYKHFQYFNVITQGEQLLESRVLNIKQLNTQSHQFWIVYFKSLLATGKYKDIIEYKEQFKNEDLNLLIATALYNYGDPNEALVILENKVYLTNIYSGYVYNLMASIYDWLGDNKKSAKYFEKALKYNLCGELKYQLYKKYSLYIDFRIPECQKKLRQAVDYYQHTNMKQYAECLHNYGTGFVMINNFYSAKQNLELSVDILNKICANEVYYPLNSLGILYAYDGYRYKEAIDSLVEALKYDIDVEFCELAIHNNLFNIYICVNDIESATSEKILLKKIFAQKCHDLKHISKERPDMQHQLRQFYYNCALLYNKKNELEKALQSLIKAQKCSTYNSVVLYSINQNIKEIKRRLGIFNINISKYPEPTYLEKKIHESSMYLCEIMFWG